jgi:serine/threonine protein kinase
VAVKLLRENVMNDTNDFLNEISYMCGLNHKNLTKLYGIALKTEHNIAIMVTELAPMGSLFNFIQSEKETILYSMLHSYSYQISCGMEYLESKFLVHRDLAARNILLFSRDKVKICDFGMMRRLNGKKDCLKIEPNSKVPYCWYPPEALKNKLFNIKSDVWAYGITLWEIFSFGERPWINLSSTQVSRFVQMAT